MTIMGPGLLFVPIAVMDGVKMVTPLWTLCGAAIYGIGLHAAAMAWRAKRQEKSIPIIEERIAALEANMAARAAKKA
jgi:hypothetical protein